ncbi:MAG: MGMT family protein [Hyphomicrobium sp.]
MELLALKGSLRARVLALLKSIPAGRVASAESLGECLECPQGLVTAVLSKLSDDERRACPWHRIVARGGAIGRGSTRDEQFARLVREGVVVSPAGIVQDMGRTAVTDFAGLQAAPGRHVPPEIAPATAPAGLPKGRSRGMKDRPGR